MKRRESPNGGLNFAGVGESSHLELREDHLTVDLDVVDAAASLEKLDLGAKFLLQLGRQPGGPRQVVSLVAVFDGDIHGTLRAIFTAKRIPWSSGEAVKQ